jgi:hypothetical protein
MTIDFTCQKCEGGFEIDAQDLIDGTEKLVCPHCDAKAPPSLTEDFVSALSEMLSQAAALSKKFAVSLAVESEELDEDEDEEDDDDDEDEVDDLEEDGDDDDEDDDDDDDDDEDEDDEEREEEDAEER